MILVIIIIIIEYLEVCPSSFIVNGFCLIKVGGLLWNNLNFHIILKLNRYDDDDDDDDDYYYYYYYY